jgi:hypothetical protein
MTFAGSSQTGEIMTGLVYSDHREHEGEVGEEDPEELHESFCLR